MSRLLRTITKNEDQTLDQNNGLEPKVSKEENKNFTNDRFRRNSPTTYQNFSSRPHFTYGNNNPNIGRSYHQRSNQSLNRSDGHRSRDESFNDQNGNWRNSRSFSRSPSTQKREVSLNDSYRQPRSDQPNNFAFRRPDKRSMSGITDYEQKLPQNNNQASSEVARFTTTDDTINELSDRCPLNC